MASASSSQPNQRRERRSVSSGSGMRSFIANTKRDNASNAASQNRSVMLRSSGLSSSVAVTVFGSNAMPQIGQAPGASLTTSGCIGQV